MAIHWDGITKSSSLSDAQVESRNKLAHAARNFNWNEVLNLIHQTKVSANSWRLDGKSYYTPLHQAAYAGASSNVIQSLLDLGAWRTLKNARNERPVDIAQNKGHHQLLNLLEPVYQHTIPPEIIKKTEYHFHKLIHDRGTRYITQENLRLPPLSILQEIDTPEMWFPIPGMYGGFKYRLETSGTETKLITESWSRVVEGSGQRHEITSSGTTLIAKGFI